MSQISKSEMLNELMEFMETFSASLAICDITYQQGIDYVIRKLSFSEVLDIYRWTFTCFMKLLQPIHKYLTEFTPEIKKNMELLHGPTHQKFLQDIKTARIAWEHRPWKK